MARAEKGNGVLLVRKNTRRCAVGVVFSDLLARGYSLHGPSPTIFERARTATVARRNIIFSLDRKKTYTYI